MKASKSTAPTFEKVWEMFQESKIEDERRRIEQEQRNIEIDKKFKELSELFTGQWGKLIEALLGPGCLSLFKKRGIKVTQTSANVTSEKNGKQMEIDVLLVNDTELVVIEIKSTASVKYIDKLLLDLQEFKFYFPQYKNYKVYGGMAALRYYAESDKYATRKGLFVLKSTGENLIRMENKATFKPQSF